MLRYFLLLIVLSVSAPVRHADQEEKGQPKSGFFTNPLFDGADPWLIRKEETKRIWEAPDTGWNRSCIWAPELHFLDDRWYIYYAAGESGPPYIHQKTGVLQSETEDPMGPYRDMGVLYTGDNPDMKSNNVWAIDMTVFRYRGRLFAVWSGWGKPAQTDKTSQHLYIASMKNPYTMERPRVRISSPEESWETGGPLNFQEK